MSAPFYFSIENFGYPLLFFGIFLAFFQFAYAESVKYHHGGGGMVKWLANHTIKLWAVVVFGLSIFIVIKLILTAIGYVAYKLFRVSQLFNTDLLRIDDWAGLGSIAVLILIIYLVIRGIQDWLKNKLNKNKKILFSEIKTLLEHQAEIQKELIKIDKEIANIALKECNQNERNQSNPPSDDKRS